MKMNGDRFVHEDRLVRRAEGKLLHHGSHGTIFPDGFQHQDCIRPLETLTWNQWRIWPTKVSSVPDWAPLNQVRWNSTLCMNEKRMIIRKHIVTGFSEVRPDHQVACCEVIRDCVSPIHAMKDISWRQLRKDISPRPWIQARRFCTTKVRTVPKWAALILSGETRRCIRK